MFTFYYSLKADSRLSEPSPTGKGPSRCASSSTISLPSSFWPFMEARS